MPAASPRKPAPEPAADAILALNNIEVVYDRVILVLKGVSLSVEGRHRRAPWRQRRRQDHDPQGDLRTRSAGRRTSHLRARGYYRRLG